MRLAIVAALLLAGPVPARAEATSYTGRCVYTATDGLDPGGQPASMDIWQGVVSLVSVVRDGTGAPATAAGSCELVVDGESRGTVLGPVSGPGVLADAARIGFVAHWDADVRLCTHVTVAQTELTGCAPAYRSPDPRPGVIWLIPPDDA